MPRNETDRYSRNEGLFGAEGQAAIAERPVAIMGLGGLGAHVAQQLAYLGTKDFLLVDDDHVTPSSMNRLVTADDVDVAAATPKVEAARRRILAISPSANIHISSTKLDEPAVERSMAGRVVFGCLDNDLSRLVLTGICSRRAVPLLDLATDVDTTSSPAAFGGRVVTCVGSGCLVCLQLLNQQDLARAGLTPEQLNARQRIYGVGVEALDGTGPMVVSINGTVASLAVTEFVALVTGLRPVNRHLSYYGHLSQLRLSRDEPLGDCYYCAAWRRSDR